MTTKINYNQIKGAVINALDYGADPTGVASSTAAIQAAIDSFAGQGGTLFIPEGTYKISAAVTLEADITVVGVGGYGGTILSGGHAGNIFQHPGYASVVLRGLAFYGSGCTGIKQTVAGAYTQSWIVEDCHFYANLLSCMEGNLILCDIRNNTFGYYGNAGATHAHIRSTGVGNATTNINRISRNRFWNARGAGWSILFQEGFHVVIEENDFESNSVVCVELEGLYISEIKNNWFENNAFTSYLSYSNSSVAVNPNLVNVVSNNWFRVHAAVTNLILYGNAGAVNFHDNAVNPISGTQRITNGNDAFLGAYYNNTLSPGYASQPANFFSLGGIRDAGGTPRLTITGDGRVMTASTLFCQDQGAAITAANNLVLVNDGNFFHVAGATQINLIAPQNGGTEITLMFDSNPVVAHNQAPVGDYKALMLAGAANFSASANDILTLVFDATTDKWMEKSRTVI